MVKVKKEINSDVNRIKKDILEEVNTMDEKIKPKIREDATFLKDVIIEEVKFQFNTDEYENKIGEVEESISDLRTEITKMGSGFTT